MASTKAFTTQLTVLVALSVAIGRAKGTIDRETEGRLTDALIAHSDEDGQPFRLKVGTCSNGRWALIPIEVGQLAARVPMAAIG